MLAVCYVTTLNTPSLFTVMEDRRSEPLQPPGTSHLMADSPLTSPRTKQLWTPFEKKQWAELG